MNYKNLELNEDEKQCYVNDELVPITKNEYLLLEFLLDNVGKVFTRVELLEILSGKSLRTVDTAISRLRKKIKEDYIKTRIGFGYGII